VNPENPQTLARVTGVFFILTFITAIGADILYDSVLNEPGYIIGAGADNSLLLGALLELLLIIANIGTAVALFPILKRQNEALSLGYVTARVVECVFIAVGIVGVLAVVTLRQEAAGADAGSLSAVGQSLVAFREWTFLLGPGFVVGIGNGLMLGYLMYKSGLVPRPMAMLGLIGGPLATASGIAVLLDVIEAGSTAQFIMTALEILWEASLGLYLTIKGFRPSPILREGSAAVRPQRDLKDHMPATLGTRTASETDATRSREGQS
jgi:hypothetical protein